MTPNYQIKVKRSRCIGRFYIVYSPRHDRQFLVNCLDATPQDQPKRMRVQQCSSHGGEVLSPGQYEILEKNPTWD